MLCFVNTSCLCAEAQKQTLQKLTAQKSHSFTAGAKQTDSPVADFCPAKRFDAIALDSPAPKPSESPKPSPVDNSSGGGEPCNSPKVKALQHKLRKQITEEHKAEAETVLEGCGSPRINSRFEQEQLPEQLPGNLTQQVMTHVEQTEAKITQQLHVEKVRSRTYLTADSWDSNTSQGDFAEQGSESCTLAATDSWESDIRCRYTAEQGSRSRTHFATDNWQSEDRLQSLTELQGDQLARRSEPQLFVSAICLFACTTQRPQLRLGLLLPVAWLHHLVLFLLLPLPLPLVA